MRPLANETFAPCDASSDKLEILALEGATAAAPAQGINRQTTSPSLWGRKSATRDDSPSGASGAPTGSLGEVPAPAVLIRSQESARLKQEWGQSGVS